MPAPDLSSYKVAFQEGSSSTKFDNLVQAVQDEFSDIDPDQISGYPSDATKLLRGDGTWPIMPFCQLSDTILGADTPSFDIQNIPQTFNHLRLAIYARGDEAATTSIMSVRFNNDSGANYDHQLLAGSGATPSASETFAATSARVGVIPGNTAGANLFGQCAIDIFHYANTVSNKTLDSNYAVKFGTSTGNMAKASNAGFWRSNSAISRITVIQGGTNFKTGSRVTLYGLL